MSRWYQFGTGELASVTTITATKSSGCDGLMYWAVGLAIKWIKDNPDADPDRARSEWRKARDGAADIGTSVHDALEAWILGKCPECNGTGLKRHSDKLPNRQIHGMELCPRCGGSGHMPKLTEQTRPMFANAARWILRNVAYVEATETTVYNPEEGYAGRCDLVAVMAWEMPCKVCDYWGLDADTQESMRCPHCGGVYSILPRYVIDFKTSSKIQEPATPMQTEAYAQAWPEPVDGTGALRIDRDTGAVEWKDFTSERAVSWRSFLDCRNLFYRHDAKVAMRKAFIESEGL